MKSSKPGGQHVNKTNSAIRATHASGICVVVDNHKSQSMNKKRSDKPNKREDKTTNQSKNKQRKTRQVQT